MPGKFFGSGDSWDAPSALGNRAGWGPGVETPGCHGTRLQRWEFGRAGVLGLKPQAIMERAFSAWQPCPPAQPCPKTPNPKTPARFSRGRIWRRAGRSGGGGAGHLMKRWSVMDRRPSPAPSATGRGRICDGSTSAARRGLGTTCAGAKVPPTVKSIRNRHWRPVRPDAEGRISQAAGCWSIAFGFAQGLGVFCWPRRTLIHRG